MYRILLLQDDNPGNKRIKDYLQLSEYHVKEVSLEDTNGLMACIYNQDLVLLCCKNVTSYFSVCARVRSLTDIPIIVLTENNDEWSKIKMFQSGADDYIEEPYRNAELVARLRARIDQYHRLTRSFGYVRVHDLTIAILNRKVYLGEDEVPLTFREFEILSYLAQRPDIVVSKEEIFHAVWKEKYVEAAYNCVASYIKKIRKKIEDGPSGYKYIETVWGVGYRFRT